MKKYPTLILFLLFICITITPHTFAQTKSYDYQDHWAQIYIEEMLEKEIMTLDESNNFRPAEMITRGEFAVAMSNLLDLKPYRGKQIFSDLEEYPDRDIIEALAEKELLTGYPEGNFLPDLEISSGEAATLLIRVLNVEKKEHQPPARFIERDSSHWSTKNLLLSESLDLLTTTNHRQYITRAEAARMISRLKELETISANINDVYPLSQKIAVNSEAEEHLLSFSEESIIARNNRLVDLNQLQKNDQVFLICDGEKDIKYLKAIGPLNQDELAMELSLLLDEALSPQEIIALSEGSWDLLGSRLRGEIEGYLLQEGLTPNEINALLQTDWNALEDHGRSRIIEAISMETGIPRDLVSTIITRDWESAKDIAQLELLQRLVEELLDPSNLNL